MKVVSYVTYLVLLKPFLCSYQTIGNSQKVKKSRHSRFRLTNQFLENCGIKREDKTVFCATKSLYDTLRKVKTVPL